MGRLPPLENTEKAGRRELAAESADPGYIGQGMAGYRPTQSMCAGKRGAGGAKA